MSADSRLLSAEQVLAIRAERTRLVAERLTAHNAGMPMMRFLSGPVVGLLDHIDALTEMAQELARTIAIGLDYDGPNPDAVIEQARQVLTKVQEAGLLP